MGAVGQGGSAGDARARASLSAAIGSAAPARRAGRACSALRMAPIQAGQLHEWLVLSSY